MLKVVMALGDTEETGILVSGVRINFSSHIDDVAILADRQVICNSKSNSYVQLASDLVGR
jgi:hypothetical protein